VVILSRVALEGQGCTAGSGWVTADGALVGSTTGAPPPTSATIVSVLHHVLTPADWERAKAGGRLEPTFAEGFVHCSSAEQLPGIVARFYADVPGLLVLDIDESRLGAALRWEPAAHPDGSPTSADEPRFPHVHGAVSLDAVVAVRPWRDP